MLIEFISLTVCLHVGKIKQIFGDINSIKYVHHFIEILTGNDPSMKWTIPLYQYVLDNPPPPRLKRDTYNLP